MLVWFVTSALRLDVHLRSNSTELNEKQPSQTMEVTKYNSGCENRRIRTVKMNPYPAILAIKYYVFFSAVAIVHTGPRSAVGNVSGYRCESDCRSRGCEFDPGPTLTFVEIDYEIISTVIQEGLLSVTSESTG